MKRITALSLIIFLIAALLLSSCGTGIKKGDTKTDPEETTEAAAMENDSDDPGHPPKSSNNLLRSDCIIYSSQASPFPIRSGRKTICTAGAWI